MVLRNKSPVTRIGRVVTVVAHNPVVVHIEGIFVTLLTIDVDLFIFYLQIVIFVDINNSLIQWQVFERELNCSALLRNPKWAKIIGCPRILLRVWECLLHNCVWLDANYIIHLSEGFNHRVCEW